MANRLAQQTSPYLLQHQHNPVDWYPWGPEALETAARLDRPILLSIGYSACHWCHVMERESFEDPATAAHMNAHFVNVKVDREERPDLDELYMRALQAFTGGHGGWPMTVFLTPQGSPFFCGTYFPPTPRQGMPSFRQVMDHARRLYHDGKADLAEVTSEMRRYLDASGRLPGPAPEVGNDWLERVARAAAAEHDPARGGFGQAPKFPPHGTLAVLLAHHHRTGDRQSLAMATGTLDAMARGGMYDQLGGGFARYSVDDAWRVPHFEKMLYDNAQLLAVYTDAWVLTGKPLYERVVRETVDFLLRELRDPRGGFWSALDADSEGVEGRYYAWTPAQVATALQDTPVADRAAQVCALLGVTEEGTFEHGSSVLRLERPLDTLPGDQQALLRQALPALARARDLRTRPGTDDKVITAWNALAISALARAAAAFDEEPWFEAAATAAAFLLEQVTVDGRLMRTWKASADGGRAHLPAYADDHAFLVQALVDLYQANFDESWLRDANRLCDRMLALFWDDDAGGLFYTGHDAEPLVSRSKHMMGGAEPAANGVAALAMLRLAALSDRPELRDRAELVVRCYRPLLEQAPRALGAEALAAAWLAGPSLEIGLVGPFHRQDTVALLDVVRRRFLPFSVVAVVEPG
ncbi:thioredoxin domain-containing protein, partial [Myxococcota bacterium]|nr:thioredoxin domain-containing protein [Myxococcota bacterium]